MTDRADRAEPGIAVAIVVHDGKVLMVRRRVPEGVLSWQFPAGAVETGENPQEAAAREAFEETGLSVDGVLVLGERVHPTTGRHLTYVVCRAITGEAHVADEHDLSAVSWVSHADLPAYVPPGLFQPVQDYLDQHLAR